MGKRDNRSSCAVYFKLISRTQILCNHPRSAFMFENANMGGDTVAETLSVRFPLPPNGKAMIIM